MRRQSVISLLAIALALQTLVNTEAHAATSVRVTDDNQSQFSQLSGEYVCYEAEEGDAELGTIGRRTLRVGTRWVPLDNWVRGRATLVTKPSKELTASEKRRLAGISRRNKTLYRNIATLIEQCEGGLGIEVTPTAIPATPTPRATATRTPSGTRTPAQTSTPTPRATATRTAAPTATNAPVRTSTPSVAPTSTPTRAATATPTSVATSTPTRIPTSTPTTAPTSTPTPRPTATPQPTATTRPVATATPTATSIPNGAGQLWSNPATWGGSIPQEGQSITIPAGKTVILDQDSPKLRGLTINGELVFADKALNLTADWILLHGTLRIGSEANRYNKKAIITLTGANTSESVMGMGTRGILSMGGRLELYGRVPNVTWTKLSSSASRGANSLSLLGSPQWSVGDSVVIAPTTFRRTSRTELSTISQVSGSTIGLSGSLSAARWGVMQYVTNNGISLTPGTITKPDPSTPTEIDERAEVGNLTRSIVIQGADDSLWRDSGFGAHVMIMERSSVTTIDGVEFRRVGQAGVLGRYPMHWHILSYDAATGRELGDATNQTLRNSAIWGSQNRCVTIHATNGVLVDNNICYDIAGHGIFLEDGDERRNVITNNLVLGAKSPASNRRLQMHDDQASGFWLSNPDNTVVGNVSADNSSFGFWNAFSDRIFGATRAVRMRPSNVHMGLFQENVSHSNGDAGIMWDNPASDEAGNTNPLHYTPTTDEQEQRYSNSMPFGSKSNVLYKNQGNGIWSRTYLVKLENFVNVDNEGKFFSGAGNQGYIGASLAVGQTLNNADRPQTPAVAFATYHSEFRITKNIIMNFPLVVGKQSGAFATDDYYITAVDKGMALNDNNLIINSDPGWRQPPLTSENWTLAGALFDPNGIVGPRNNYWVYDMPFFTSGTTCTPVAPAGSNGMSCRGDYYGVVNFQTDFDNGEKFIAPVEGVRYNSSFGEIGRWTVGDGRMAPMLENMRHFAAIKDGTYSLRFPNRSVPLWVKLSVTNAYRATDSMMLGVTLSSSVASPLVTISTGNSNTTQSNSTTRQLSATSSFDAVKNSSGNLYWFDRTNQLVWIKVVGGLPAPYDELYGGMNIFIR